MSLIQGAHECLSANNSIWRISPRKSSLSSKLLLFLNSMLSSSILKPAWTSPLPWPILRAPLHMSQPLMTFWSWPKTHTLICAKTANGQVCPIGERVVSWVMTPPNLPVGIAAGIITLNIGLNLTIRT